MEIPNQAQRLTAAFLDAHGERIVEDLSERLRQAGAVDLLPAHRVLFDLARACVRGASPSGLPADIRRALAGVDPRQESLVSGQVALWDALHRMLWEVEGPHRNLDVIHAVLALVGGTLDGLIGALIDLARSGPAPSPGWETLRELGRTHREFQTLNRLTRDLVSARDPDRMFDVLEDGILGTFHLRSLVIAAVDREEGYVEVVRTHQATPIARDPTGWRYDLSHPEILCEVARTGRAEVIDGWDPRYHERVVQPDGSVVFRQRPRDFNAGQTAFFIPILAGDCAIGVVATGSNQAGKQIVLGEIERMRPFLHQVGAALSTVSEIIRRRRAEEELREAHDALERRVTERTAELSTANALLRTQILERRRAEEAQAQLTDEVELQRKRLDDILTTVPGIVWEAWGEPDAATQRIDFVSDHVETMLGYSVEEWLTTPNFWLTIVHPDDKERAARTAAQAFASGRWHTNQFRWIAKDGRVVWVEAQAEVVRDEAGAPVGMRGVTMDISERKRAEEALRESEEYHRIIMETAEDAIVTIDEESRILSVNRATEDMFGYPASEMVGQPLTILMPERLRSVHLTALGQYVNIGRRHMAWNGIELPGLHKNGKEVPLEISFGESLRGNRRIFTGIIRNITERRRAEEALREAERLKVLAQAAVGTAHEIFQPLTAVLGQAEILLTGMSPDDPRQKALEIIRRAGYQISDIVNKMKTPRRYVTRAYVKGVDMVDFDAAAQEGEDP